MNKNVLILLVGTGVTVLIFFILLIMSVNYTNDDKQDNPDIAGVSDDISIAEESDEALQEDQNNAPIAEDVEELSIETVVEGTGVVSKDGDVLVVHYTGTLLDGTKFDSSVDRGNPFDFELGSGRVIQGWEEGMKGMKVGEKRILTIPSQMGYGEYGSPPLIPGNSALVFEVELLEIK